MTGIQTIINAIFFFWMLGITAVVARLSWGRTKETSAQRQSRQLAEQVENSQRLIKAMSDDILSLSQRMLQELDELRNTVSAMTSRTSEVSFDSHPQPTVPDEQVNHPFLERYRNVYQRAAQGKSVTQIAKELDMGKGEVELVLALRQQSNTIRHKS